MRSRALKPLLTEKLTNMEPEEFGDLLVGKHFMRLRVPEKTVNDILTKNDFNEVKLKLLDLFLGLRPIEERLDDVLEIYGIGPYIASHLLSAVNNEEYIIYHENVVKGIDELLHHLADWEILDLSVMKTAEQYLDFNAMCKSIKKRFGFKSLGEVHEFFWHGNNLGWKF